MTVDPLTGLIGKKGSSMVDEGGRGRGGKLPAGGLVKKGRVGVSRLRGDYIASKPKITERFGFVAPGNPEETRRKVYSFPGLFRPVTPSPSKQPEA